MSWTRALPVFSIAFGLIYVPCLAFNWPVFTYVPRTGEFYPLLFQPQGAQAPGMFYYGWLLTAGFGAAIVAAASLKLPEIPAARLVNLTWIVPLLLFVVELYILRDWFMR